MESPDGLYRVSREQLKELSHLFADAFADDPLYAKLIPASAQRRRMLPKLFHLYLSAYYDHCQIFADSKDLNGALVLCDQKDVDYEASFAQRLLWLRVGLRALWYAFCQDPTGRIARALYECREFLTSKWAEGIPGHIQIDFLVVSPKCQGKGIATALVSPVLAYADSNTLRTTLETHNPRNVDFYGRFGFHVVEQLSSCGLRQYCLKR